MADAADGQAMGNSLLSAQRNLLTSVFNFKPFWLGACIVIVNLRFIISTQQRKVGKKDCNGTTKFAPSVSLWTLVVLSEVIVHLMVNVAPPLYLQCELLGP